MEEDGDREMIGEWMVGTGGGRYGGRRREGEKTNFRLNIV